MATLVDQDKVRLTKAPFLRHPASGLFILFSGWTTLHGILAGET